MEKTQQAVVLIGHGGVPKDFPRGKIRELKRLESLRGATGLAPGPQELELDQCVREWPRSPETDPYKAGLESLAAHLAPLLKGVRLEIAYNEFCAPTLEDTIGHLVSRGIEEISVMTTMLTPGGSHSEQEIPQKLAALRSRHPGVNLRYVWPYDLALVADMMARQIQAGQFTSRGTAGPE